MCQSNYIVALTGRYGAIPDTLDYLRKAQLADYETWRAMFEGRNAQMFDPYTGIMLWMTNCAQPSTVWQIYDYNLEPNSAYFAVKHATEMLHVQMTPAGEVQVINNLPASISALSVKAAIYDMDGSYVTSQSATVSALASSVTDAFTINWPATLSPVHFVKLTLTDNQGNQLSSNFYWHTALGAGSDYRSLNTMPVVTLMVYAKREETAGNLKLTVKLVNPSNHVALLAHLQLRRQSTGERVLPVYYSDNYVSLLPGESQTITVQAAVADLGGDRPLLTVDGWNVTAKPYITDPVAVGQNLAVGFAHPSVVHNIDCGMGWATGWGASHVVSNAWADGADATDDNVDTTDVPLAAPELVYRTQQIGDSQYTIPAAPGKIYSILLHFVETYYTSPGDREFNVTINGNQVLTNFDIYAAAGAKDKACVKVINGIQPNADGNIVIAFTSGAKDQPLVAGIQVVDGNVPAQ
jgi:hypothetical protein